VSAQEPRLARRDSSPLKPEMSWKEPWLPAGSVGSSSALQPACEESQLSGK
jgi:hypothetical protein